MLVAKDEYLCFPSIDQKHIFVDPNMTKVGIIYDQINKNEYAVEAFEELSEMKQHLTKFFEHFLLLQIIQESSDCSMI